MTICLMDFQSTVTGEQSSFSLGQGLTVAAIYGFLNICVPGSVLTPVYRSVHAYLTGFSAVAFAYSAIFFPSRSAAIVAVRGCRPSFLMVITSSAFAVGANPSKGNGSDGAAAWTVC